jgi:tryptophan synthase beta chain
LAAAIEEALRCKETGEQKVILTALCGHAHLDLPAYGRYLAGEIVDYDLGETELARALSELPVTADR